MALSITRETRWLVGLIAACTALLWVTSIPEVFTLDECNYLSTVTALRHGSLFVPGTADLTPTPELSGFDPSNTTRAAQLSPVPPTVPPLYAPLAAPLSILGWRGLVLLNALAFAATAALVFRFTKRYATHARTPWLAMATYVLGGFCLAYAQGMWPHMLSVGLATGAAFLAARARDDDRLASAAGAGLLIGWAAGVRYQNVALAAAIGLTLVVWSRRRALASLAYAGGLAVPLGATSLINHARLGTYNPVSKGDGYLASSSASGPSLATALGEKWTALWSMVVDYSAHPPFRERAGRGSLPKTPGTGAFLVVGGLKKALLQSAPWIAIAIVALLLAWTSFGARRLGLGDEKRRALRALGVPIFAVLALFAWAGLERPDGWCFNQRYLLELVPLFAITLALVADEWTLDPQALVIGGALGIALAAIPIAAVVPEHAFRQRALITVPLVLAVGFVVASLVPRVERLRVALYAASLGWAFAVHVGDDCVAERGLRDFNGFQRTFVEAELPRTPTALFASAPQKEAMCRSQLDRDLVLADPSSDAGEGARLLTTELAAHGRRVFVVGRIPKAYLGQIFADRAARVIATDPLPFAEVVARAPSGAATEKTSD